MEGLKYIDPKRFRWATLKEDDNKFHFTIEGTGALPPVEILRKAFKILKQKIMLFENDLTKNVTSGMGNQR